MARTRKTLAAAPVAEPVTPEEEQVPHYETSRTEEYLNYLDGTSESYPEAPNSRLEEYLDYFCKHGMSLGKFVVYSEGTMQTSTLPAIAVPVLTSEQLSQILTAFSQDKQCIIKTTDENMLVNQSDNLNHEIKVWYHNYYLTYTLEGDTVVVSYISIGQ